MATKQTFVTIFDLQDEYKYELATLNHHIHLLYEDLKQRNDQAYKRKKEERLKLLSSRKFNYYIESIYFGEKHNQWHILCKSATEPVDNAQDNKQWSVPFKVVNNVLIYARESYQSMSFQSATNVLESFGGNGAVVGSYEELTHKLLQIQW